MARPHIVLIVADDLGWGDVGFHGSVIETPTLDGLASEGAELDRYDSMPTCIPTRATLMTGQLALGLGVLHPLPKKNPTDDCCPET